MIGRRRIRRARRGDFEVRLPPHERGLIASLLPQLRELLATGAHDPSTRRLFPTAYPQHDDLDREYRRLVHDDLLRRRLDAIDVVESTLDQDRLDEEQMLAWMGAVNDLRLVLGTRLDVSEETDLSIDPDDPNAAMLAAYFYLGWLLEQIVDALDT